MTSSPPPSLRGLPAWAARRLGPEDAAVFETVVVPRYLSLFGDPLLDLLVPGADAQVCHLFCRTGYPDRELLEKLPDAHVFGCDVSEAAIVLAKTKAGALPKRGAAVFDYRVIDGIPLPFPNGAFSHAFALHPLAAHEERAILLPELARVTAPRGQALVAMPMRGSFVEIADLLRECALKFELTDLSSAVDRAVHLRPTEEIITRELEHVGFEYVEVDVRTRTLRWETGRDFFDDPIAKLLFFPEFRLNLDVDLDKPFAYVREAIDKYWSEGSFGLTVNVGVASGRRSA